MPRQRFLLVHNRTAGAFRHGLVPRVVAELADRGAHVSTAPNGTGVTAASGFDAVIAAGGDGTIRALARDIAGSGLPIGIIPVGTGNVFAAETGVPRSAAPIADMLIDGPEIEVAGGLANGVPFYLMAGAGFDGEIIRRLDGERKRRLGKLAYAGPITAALAARPPQLEITIDGARHEARWVVVANARHYAGDFIISPGAHLMDETFDVVLFRRFGGVTSVARLLAVAAGRHTRLADVEVVKGRHIRIEAAEPVATEIDGDAHGTTPLVVTPGTTPIRLVVPRSFRLS